MKIQYKDKNIEVEKGQIGFIEVKNHFGIKIGTYIVYWVLFS